MPTEGNHNPGVHLHRPVFPQQGIRGDPGIPKHGHRVPDLGNQGQGRQISYDFL